MTGKVRRGKVHEALSEVCSAISVELLKVMLTRLVLFTFLQFANVFLKSKVEIIELLLFICFSASKL